MLIHHSPYTHRGAPEQLSPSDLLDVLCVTALNGDKFRPCTSYLRAIHFVWCVVLSSGASSPCSMFLCDTEKVHNPSLLILYECR